MSKRSQGSDCQPLVMLWRGPRDNPGMGALADPFARNPIRRSFGLIVVCGAVVFGPLLIQGRLSETIMLSVGWLALTGMVIGTPILIWSLAEESLRVLRRRLQPPVDLLQISPRVAHILQRHGFDSIVSVEETPDEMLLTLSNMDHRSLAELRRAIAIWKYRQWQERGFPARGF